MKKIYLLSICCLLLYPFLYGQNDIKTNYQKGGPFNQRSYLVYCLSTKDAAFIDAGSNIDSLVGVVKSEGLNLKYIFLTHAHQDHIVNLNCLRRIFPSSKVCFSKQEFDDFKFYLKWKEIFDAKSVAAWQKDSTINELMNFDYTSVSAPDIFLEDKQEFQLGNSKILVTCTSGHSRGSITFSIANMIFPGDLILYHSAGDLDYPLCSKDEITESIRKLYRNFSDETKICSGHGKPSTIGYEKLHNTKVSMDKTSW
jgi:hydroxyacylglutathione hydrolase